VTIDDLRRVGSQYISSLFDPAKSKVVICCHPTKVDETVGELMSWWVDTEDWHLAYMTDNFTHTHMHLRMRTEKHKHTELHKTWSQRYNYSEWHI